MSVAFSKYSGLGNDFILIDNRCGRFPLENSSLIKQLCKRPQGIGADGVILLEHSAIADIKMRIFNADGSEAEMCGNGIRCLMKFMLEIGMPEKPYKIETYESILQGHFVDDLVSIDMGQPKDIKWNLNVDGKLIHFLNTGVPHAVMLVEDLKKVDVEKTGKTLRHHKAFSPKGTNVTFFQILAPGHLIFCTFERGVEAETLSCGTGAAAAAFAYIHLQKLELPVIIENKLGEKMSFTIDDNLHIHMQGPVCFVFKGQFAIENN